jgi:hypothetical protein
LFYFWPAVANTFAMATTQDFQRGMPSLSLERENQVRQKRIATLAGIYELMRRRYVEVREYTRLHHGQVAAAVEDYIADRRALVGRQNITGRIQRHKVAGMMAAAIVKNSPIQLLDYDAPQARLSRDNETFAVLHGISICADGAPSERFDTLLRLPHVGEWFSDFVYLLHRHPSNTESFILIFETLCLAYFPESLDSAADGSSADE